MKAQSACATFFTSNVVSTKFRRTITTKMKCHLINNNMCGLGTRMGGIDTGRSMAFNMNVDGRDEEDDDDVNIYSRKKTQ